MVFLKLSDSKTEGNLSISTENIEIPESNSNNKNNENNKQNNNQNNNNNNNNNNNDRPNYYKWVEKFLNNFSDSSFQKEAIILKSDCTNYTVFKIIEGGFNNADIW